MCALQWVFSIYIYIFIWNTEWKRWGSEEKRERGCSQGHSITPYEGFYSKAPSSEQTTSFTKHQPEPRIWTSQPSRMWKKNLIFIKEIISKVACILFVYTWSEIVFTVAYHYNGVWEWQCGYIFGKQRIDFICHQTTSAVDVKSKVLKTYVV